MHIYFLFLIALSNFSKCVLKHLNLEEGGLYISINMETSFSRNARSRLLLY